MPTKGRRRFVGSLAGATAGLGAAAVIEAQAPPRAGMSQLGERRRRLAAALRELNQAAGLGVPPDDLEAAEAYATGAILDAEAKLRPRVLGAGLDLPVVFGARRLP